MPDFLINTLQGGLNEESPISIGDDQCTVAQNVEWIDSPLGDRRKGATAIDITGSDLVGKDRVTFLHQHLPSTDVADAELWAFGVKDSPASNALVYKDTAWNTVSPVDAIDVTEQYALQAQTLHGKLFLAYKSAQDRLHVWDGTSLRRTGLAEPAAPTAANQGSGSLAGTRYYRVRYTVQASGVTLRRSEPSDVLTFAPSGTGASVRVTKPASISESETHWELEASVDNANFYRIATTAVGTTTYDDSTPYSPGYGDFTLSEDVGDYTLLPSARYLTADEDRLIYGGSFEDDALASRVGWTPVFGAPGAGNDERSELDTDPTLDLDNYSGGPLTGLSRVVNGYFYATKLHHIYQMKRTGVRERAYEQTLLTAERGALHGSLVEGLDQSGNPTFFCLDPDIGPCRISARGVEPCGRNLKETWKLINLNATKVVCRAVFFPEKQQVHWWIATSGADIPNLRIVLHTNQMRDDVDGSKRGWAIWTGPSAAALAVCMFAENIDDDTDRSRKLKPFIALEGSGLIWRTDTGDDDNGTEYSARMVTKPFVHGNLLHQFGVMAGALMAKAAAGASLKVTVIGNFDEATLKKEVSSVDLTPAATETNVIKFLHDLSLSELRTVQVEFEDVATPGARWQLEQFALKESHGQRA